MFKKKPQPISQQPKEIVISPKPWKKRLKWFFLVLLVLILGVGLWIGFTANQAIKKITEDSGNSSNIFSFLGDFNSGKIKGQADGRTNILIMGMGGKNHPGGMLSDTMITASINYKDSKIGLISVPRDLWAPIPGFNHAKINEAYSDGENNKKATGGGGALSSRTVENVLGIPIHYYVSMDFEGFKKIVDTVGGIDIYVENDIYDPYYPADNMIDYAPFKISKGEHHMDGATALKYARSRKTTSDFDRSRRQMQVMSAIKEKILSLDILANPKKITDLMNILGDHIRTNMQVSEMRALWDSIKNIDTTNMTNKVLDTSQDGLLTASQDWRGYYEYPKKGIDNFSEIQNFARNLFNESYKNEAQARIEILNGTGKKGAASTVSQYLQSYGYTVTKTGNADKLYEKTTIVDFSGGKFPQTVEKIASQLQAEKKTSETTRTSIDIQVIVGQDYLSNL